MPNRTIKDNAILHQKKAGKKIIQPKIYNTILASPTRSGKGVSSIIPALLSYPGVEIVLDFKGENFKSTLEFGSKFGKVEQTHTHSRNH
jgi:type IV secretion system protein VirD4